jgi:hypothetical protein
MKCARPVRVLQIVDSLGMGGAETGLMEVLLWSKSEVGRIDFLATSGNPGIFDGADQYLVPSRTDALAALSACRGYGFCALRFAQSTRTGRRVLRLKE